MRYIPHTESDIREMLTAIGLQRVDELFDCIPDGLRLENPLEIPPALSEPDLVQTLKRMGQRNLDAEEYAIFLGAGAYRHCSPSLVNHMILRGEFATSYTPYQPEVSQGTLQAIFEFQSMIAMLTGMDIANASMYDGASSLAEAVLMAHRVNGGDEVIISRAVHPEARQVIETYIQGMKLKCIEVPYLETGQSDLEGMMNRVTDRTAAVVLQSPNFLGVVEEYAGLGDSLASHPALFVVAVGDATSLGLLKPPGERGADIAVGDGQAFGLPVSFGGPYVGFFACREKFFRQVPGRIVGQTVDQRGARAFALTLATREQHIRREKATSNICTNQGLCALAATVFMAALGKQGLRDMALQNLRHADYMKNRLSKLDGFRVRFASDTYNEFVLECPGPAREVQETLLKEKIVAGLPLGDFYPELDRCLLLCATEVTSQDAIDRLADRLGSL